MHIPVYKNIIKNKNIQRCITQRCLKLTLISNHIHKFTQFNLPSVGRTIATNTTKKTKLILIPASILILIRSWGLTWESSNSNLAIYMSVPVKFMAKYSLISLSSPFSLSLLNISRSFKRFSIFLYSLSFLPSLKTLETSWIKSV